MKASNLCLPFDSFAKMPIMTTSAAGNIDIEAKFGKSGPNVRNDHGNETNALETNAPEKTATRFDPRTRSIKQYIPAGNTTPAKAKFTALIVVGIVLPVKSTMAAQIKCQAAG